MTGTSGGAPTDPKQDCYVTVHDWESDGPVAVTVAEALGACSGLPPDEIPPLYDAVDPEALDDAIRPRSDRPADARVTFTVPELDYAVTVRGDGRVEIADRR